MLLVHIDWAARIWIAVTEELQEFCTIDDCCVGIGEADAAMCHEGRAASMLMIVGAPTSLLMPS